MKKISWLVKISFCLVALLFTVSPLRSVAISQDDLNSIVNQTPFYDPNASPVGCQVTGNTVASTLPAAVPEPHKTLFTQAASAFGTNPQFLAALFLTENSNTWKPFDFKWDTAAESSPAAGPFQFMPATWDGYKTDGNNDGTTEILSIYDAAYSAAKLISANGAKVNTPLGDINKPFVPGTFLFISAAYNWGGGHVQQNTTPNTLLNAEVVPRETQRYLNNIYGLISSGFTKSGYSGYPDPSVPTGGTSSTSAPSAGSGCSGSVVAGSIVQTALNLAWGTRGHGPNEADAKPTYHEAMPRYNGSTSDQPFSDCGVFVSTVMIATGADRNYPKRGTGIQQDYVKSHPEKYTIFENIRDSSRLQDGDILIFNNGNKGHTFIFTGKQQNGDSSAASWHDHVPEAASAVGSITYDGRAGQYIVARLKK